MQLLSNLWFSPNSPGVTSRIHGRGGVGQLSGSRIHSAFPGPPRSHGGFEDHRWHRASAVRAINADFESPCLQGASLWGSVEASARSAGLRPRVWIRPEVAARCADPAPKPAATGSKLRVAEGGPGLVRPSTLPDPPPPHRHPRQISRPLRRISSESQPQASISERPRHRLAMRTTAND